jgi:hypothetical protein
MSDIYKNSRNYYIDLYWLSIEQDGGGEDFLLKKVGYEVPVQLTRLELIEKLVKQMDRVQAKLERFSKEYSDEFRSVREFYDPKIKPEGEVVNGVFKSKDHADLMINKPVYKTNLEYAHSIHFIARKDRTDFKVCRKIMYQFKRFSFLALLVQSLHLSSLDMTPEELREGV